jgi:3-oxoacyl-[acyl-carrier protein] reductase
MDTGSPRRSIVTGGSGGIGQAVARALVDDGGRVVVIGRDESKLDAVCHDLGEAATWRSADVVDADQIHEAVTGAASELDGIDVVVPAAGYGTYFTTDTDYAEAVRAWDAEVGVDLRGAYLTILAAVPHLSRPGGRIVTISSIAAFSGGSTPGAAAYAAAKAGLVGLTRGLARELSGQGITANAVAPGYIDTAFHQGRSPQAQRAAGEQIPAGRVGQPDDIAGAVRYLVSPEASYVTGQVLHVNGGWWFGG